MAACQETQTQVKFICNQPAGEGECTGQGELCQVAASSKYKLLYSECWQRVRPILPLPLPGLSTQLLSLLLLHLTHLHRHTERDRYREKVLREREREQHECCMTQRHTTGNWLQLWRLNAFCAWLWQLACEPAVAYLQQRQANVPRRSPDNGVNSGTKAFC